MNSITQGLTVYKGHLGSIVKKQGFWRGTKPPKRRRGDIHIFSKASARRLRETLVVSAPIVDSDIYGLTLTIPGEVLTPEATRHLWSNFVRLYKKRFPNVPLIWRIELQKRGQAHWHCVLYAPKSPQEPSSIITVQIDWLWKECVLKAVKPLTERTARGFDRHGVSVESLCRASKTGLIGYLCDHQSKHKKDQLGWQGRQWGVLNAKRLTKNLEIFLELTEYQQIQAIRQFRRLQENLRSRKGDYTGATICGRGGINRSLFGKDEFRFYQICNYVLRSSD